MYKYEIWCEGGMLHESEPIYEDYEEAEVDAKADLQSYFDDYEGSKPDEDEYYYEIKEV